MKGRVEVILGDITQVEVDAIVNAANSQLYGGGGVDGAIHRAGGPSIMAECRKIVATCGHCLSGQAVISSAGLLKAKHIIHTVGPVWRGGQNNESQLLAQCYFNSLDLAEKHGCTTVAFPAISTGVYGYPVEEAAVISVESVNGALQKHKTISKVLFVCFDQANYDAIAKRIRGY